LVTSPVIRHEFTGVTVHHLTVNGDPAVLFRLGDKPYALMVLDVDRDGDRVSGVYSIVNPEKLRRLALPTI
jgi:RNA polymerase sigma-70 factor (ECF subfamily)